MALDLDTEKFEQQYALKGQGMLDQIFGEYTPEREMVNLTRPRHEREVVFVVEYQENRQFSKVVNHLCDWLKTDGDFDKLKSLMLY